MKKPSLIKSLLLSLLIPCAVLLVLEAIAMGKGVRLFATRTAGSCSSGRWPM